MGSRRQQMKQFPARPAPRPPSASGPGSDPLLGAGRAGLRGQRECLGVEGPRQTGAWAPDGASSTTPFNPEQAGELYATSATEVEMTINASLGQVT